MEILSVPTEGQLGLPNISRWKAVRHSRIGSDLLKRLEQRWIWSSFIFCCIQSVIILVPSAIKLATELSRFSLRDRKMWSEVKSGEVVSLHFMQRLRGVLLWNLSWL